MGRRRLGVEKEAECFEKAGRLEDKRLSDVCHKREDAALIAPDQRADTVTQQQELEMNSVLRWPRKYPALKPTREGWEKQG